MEPVYSPFAPKSLKVCTALSCAVLSASSVDLPARISPNMSVKKLVVSSAPACGDGGAGDGVLVDDRFSKDGARVGGHGQLARQPGFVVARVCPATDTRRQHRRVLGIGVDLLEEVQTKQSPLAVRVLVEDDDLPAVVVDL